jgi:hypothetical protein
MKKTIVMYYNNLKLSILWLIYITKPFHYLLILFLIPLMHFYFTHEVLLCDDNQGSPRETYNNYYGYNDRSTPYQAYQPGLQITSEGYRFELENNCVNYPSLKLNINGKLVYAQYSGIDAMGNHMYTYENDSFSEDSTKLGEIEPTRSEVINEAYYKATGWGHKDIITTKYNSKPGFWNKIKADFRRTREAAYKDKLASLDRNAQITRASRGSRNNRHMAGLERTNKRTSEYNNYRKVRRFD